MTGRGCGGREIWRLWRGWGLKRRDDRRSYGSAIIIEYENLAVTSAPLEAWCYVALLHLLTPPHGIYHTILPASFLSVILLLLIHFRLLSDCGHCYFLILAGIRRH